MKLRSLHIEDYKMFKDFDISFVDEHDKALPIVVLAGVNGSGKTTLLDAIIDRDTIRVNKNEKINLYKINEGFGKYKEIPNRDIIRVAKEAVEKMGIEYEEKEIFYFQAGINDTKKVEKEFVQYWYNQVKFHNKRNDEITESLQKFITDSFEGLDLFFTYSHIDEDDNIFFQNDNSEKFKINELSTGEQTLLSKVLYLFLKEYKDKVILIDEPELSLHPKWQNQVLKIYENFAFKNNCQIIIATHSPHIIGSAKNEYLRILRKKEDGSIEVINDLKAHGRDINSILFDVMGETAYRPREFKDKIDKLYEDIDNRKFEEAKERLVELKKDYGEKDSVVQEAEMLIDVLSSEE